MNPITHLTLLVQTAVGRLQHRSRRGEQGMAVVEYLGIAVISILIIVFMFPLLRDLAGDVIEWIRGELL